MRWKGVIGFAVLNVLLAVFGFFFAEGLTKNVIESVGSSINGAKVEIGQLEFSFLELSLNIKDVQVADPDDEWRNQFEVKDIRFKLSPLPLLEKKFIIEEMVIEGIRTGTTRKDSGKLPEPEEEAAGVEEAGPTIFTKGADKIKEELQALPGVQMLKGDKRINVDELVKLEELTAPREIEKIKTELDTRDKDSRAALENLNVSSRVKALKKQIASINLKEKDPIKLREELKKFKGFKEDLNALTNEMNQTKDKLQSDFDFVDNSIKQIEEIKERDYQAIIENIEDVKGVDKGNIARLVFGPIWFDRANTLLGWLDIAKRFMPEKGDDEVVKKRVRIKGENIEFPKEKTYPVFLLRTASISSGKGDMTDLKFQGKVEDISSNQALHGKPTTLAIKGTDPAFELNGTLDRRERVGQDTFKVVMLAVDLKGFDLGKSPLLPRKLAQGTARIEIDLKSKGKEIEMNLVVLPTGLVFAKEDIPAGDLAKEIANTLSTANKIRIKGKIYGHRGKFKLKIDSNIDELLSELVKRLINERIEEAKRQIRQKIAQMIEAPQQELLNEYNLKKAEVASLVKDKLVIINQAKDMLNQAENTVDTKINEEKEKLRKRIEEEKRKVAEAKRRLEEEAKRKIEEEKNKAQKEAEKKIKKRLKDKLKDMLKKK